MNYINPASFFLNSITCEREKLSPMLFTTPCIWVDRNTMLNGMHVSEIPLSIALDNLCLEFRFRNTNTKASVSVWIIGTRVC